MNLVLRFGLVVAATVVGAWAMFSRSDTVAAAPASNTTVATKVAPPAKEATAARVRERSLARWQLVERHDWVSAFDMLTTEQRRAVPLAQYLTMTEHHSYANGTVERVLHSDATDAYLVARAVWTPSHPGLEKVKLEPGQSLTSELTMIESWRWEGDDWYYVRAQREDEFQKEHPEIELKK